MRTADLDFDLPPRLIATAPADPRDSARLMVCDRATGGVAHHRVRDLPDLGLLQPGDVMITNRSRVLPARFRGRRAKTGGKAAGLFIAEADGVWELMLETRGTPEPGERITLDEDAWLELLESLGGGRWRARYHGREPTHALLELIGTTPLPPYLRQARKLRHEPEDRDEDPTRYNTVFAREAGSVAAPTAGLHFTPQLLSRLEAAGVARHEVILHVGLGTFAPVRHDNLEDHPIHDEHAVIPADTARAIHHARSGGRRVLAVGTTTVRAIESLPDEAASWSGQTDLFITPDRIAAGQFTWRHTDWLMTNFHLPRSTLLALVAALPGVGLPRLLDWYRQAIDAEYRFYSFGDAMLIV
ncbi:MAG: tRNA preQ1(34) S-adenosylmethionine ribosyltransferase-isomerase QueA [Planctomycetes bacterium]|jgi:S-adenosylmethionine:tRNA ribosyltransferase-isomerase|nr:tRNA preQ1(34) S-adenosylmethionine ribosyltransferase-isomerase QueA [Planctomycetota bacterium]